MENIPGGGVVPFFLLRIRHSPLDSSSFFSHSSALFCSFLRSYETQPFSFQSLPHSLPRKNTRRGGRVQKRRRPSRSDGGICGKGVPSSGEKIVDRFTVAKNVDRLTVTKNIDRLTAAKMSTILRRPRMLLTQLIFRWRRRRRYIRQEFPPMPLLDGVVRGHREQRRRRFRPLNVGERVRRIS